MDSIVPQLIANSIIAGGIYSLVALGFNLIFGVTKFFNLAHGAVATSGAFATFYFLKSVGLPVWLAVFIGIIVAGVLGVVLDKLVFRKLRNRKASAMIYLVASLGLFTAIQAIIAILFTSQFQTLFSGDTKVFNILGASVTDVQIITIVSAFGIMFALAFLLYKTKFGKAVRAVSDDEQVSKIVGINTDRIISKVFFIGSAIAGVAGIAIGFDTGIEPTMGMGLLLKGVIASIIGGIGNVYGGVLGAFLLGFIENFGIWKISGEWKDAIAFGVLIIFLLFRPRGIMGKK